MTETLKHRPIELDVSPGPCGMGSCDHEPGACPSTSATACEQCTFEGVDVGMADVVDVTRWPCKHAPLDDLTGFTPIGTTVR